MRIDIVCTNKVGQRLDRRRGLAGPIRVEHDDAAELLGLIGGDHGAKLLLPADERELRA